MKTICKSICCSLFIFMCSGAVVAKNLPQSDNLRELKVSYTIQDGVGKTMAYIPIDRPCLNVLSGDEYKEFCFIDSETEDLSKSNGDGFYISLDNVTNKIVSFEYNTLWYSKKCRYYIGRKNKERKNPFCDEPYTN